MKRKDLVNQVVLAKHAFWNKYQVDPNEVYFTKKDEIKGNKLTKDMVGKHWAKRIKKKGFRKTFSTDATMFHGLKIFWDAKKFRVAFRDPCATKKIDWQQFWKKFEEWYKEEDKIRYLGVSLNSQKKKLCQLIEEQLNA